MYSHEDRKRAAELYIEYGLSAADVIREPGYPNRHSPRNWHNDYPGHGGVRESAHEPRFYSDEEKRRAVDHFLGHGRKPSLTIRAPGYPGKQALYEWVDEPAPGQRRISPPPGVQFTYGQKADAVVALATRKGSAKEAAESVGTSREGLYWWKCELLGKEARSSYQYQAEALSKPDKYAEPRVRIAEIFHESGSGYGYRRIHLELRKEKVVVSEKAVCAIMKEEGLANSMLEAACSTLGEGEHPRIHSDRGCHYRWPGWIKICDGNGLERSMSKKGRSPDNSACEGFFGRLKNEVFYGEDWSGWTIEDFMAEIDAYTRWRNERRIKLTLGGMSPVEYRESLGLMAA